MYLEFIKMIAALAVVLGLMFLLMKLLRHKILPRNGLINMIQYQPMGAKRGIAIVKIAGDYFALGLSDGGISVITRVEASQVDAHLNETKTEDADMGRFNIRRLFYRGQ